MKQFGGISSPKALTALINFDSSYCNGGAQSSSKPEIFSSFSKVSWVVFLSHLYASPLLFSHFCINGVLQEERQLGAGEPSELWMAALCVGTQRVQDKRTHDFCHKEPRDS